MKRFFTLALVLVFGTFVASAQAGSKGNSSHSSSSHNSSHCDSNHHDHDHDSCHDDHCNKPPKEYMGGSKNGPPGTPENPFPPMVAMARSDRPECSPGSRYPSTRPMARSRPSMAASL